MLLQGSAATGFAVSSQGNLNWNMPFNSVTSDFDIAIIERTGPGKSILGSSRFQPSRNRDSGHSYILLGDASIEQSNLGPFRKKLLKILQNKRTINFCVFQSVDGALSGVHSKPAPLKNFVLAMSQSLHVQVQVTSRWKRSLRSKQLTQMKEGAAGSVELFRIPLPVFRCRSVPREPETASAVYPATRQRSHSDP